jgi:hypothetical protein
MGTTLLVIASLIPEEVLPAFVDALADFCFNSMYSKAPWRTGFLAMSITKTVEDNSATIKPTALYAPFVSLGTAPHEILPRTARALAFPGGVLGGSVFAARVMHPGTKPNLYIHLAAEDTRGQAFDVFSVVWQDYVGP